MALAQNLSFILLGEDKTASKTMDAAASKAEQTTGRIGSAFSKVGGVLGGEFGGILDSVGSRIDGMGGKAAKLSTGLMVGGGVATVAGVALLKMGSSYKQATDQLNQASKTAGDSVEGMSGKVEKAVATGQNFGRSAVDTKEALAKMTLATGSTQKALDNMSVVTNLAAARHISLSDAATMVDRVLGGSGSKTLSQYGIVMQKAGDPTKALAAAQKLVTTEGDKLAVAQTKLLQLQEIDQTKKKLTIQDHIALQNAQANVSKATDNLAAAQTKLAGTSTAVITKQEAGKAALDQLAKKLDGQGSASVNNFGAQVSIMRTKIQDWVDQVSGPVGSVLTALGPAFTVAGVAVDLYRAKKEAATLAEIASAAASTTAVTATGAETASMVALDVAMDANPIGLVAAALGALALVAGGLVLATTRDLTQAQRDFTSALDASNGMLDANVQKVAYKQLSDAGALKAASALGISTAVLVKASLGDAAAKALVAKQVDLLNGKLANLNQQNVGHERTTTASTVAAAKLSGNLSALKASYGDTTDALANSRSAWDSQRQTMNELAGSASYAGTQYEGLTRKMITAQQAARGNDASQSRYSGLAAYYGAGPTRRASGGTTMSSEMTMVGENGPEVVALPGGSKVYPSGTGPSGGGGGNVTFNVTIQAALADPNMIAKTLVTVVTNAARAGQIPKNAFSSALTGH